MRVLIFYFYPTSKFQLKMSTHSAVEDVSQKKSSKQGLNESLLFGCRKIRVLYYFACFLLAAWGITGLRKDRIFPQGKIPGYLFFLTFTIWGNLMALAYYALSLLVVVRPEKKFRRARRIAVHIAVCSYFVIFVFYTSALSYMDVVRIDKIINQDQAKFEWYSSVLKHFIFPVLIWIEVLSENFKLKNKDRKYVLGVVLLYGIVNIIATKLFLKFPLYPGLTWDNLYSLFFVLVNLSIVEVAHRISVNSSRHLAKKLAESNSD